MKMYKRLALTIAAAQVFCTIPVVANVVGEDMSIEEGGAVVLLPDFMEGGSVSITTGSSVTIDDYSVSDSVSTYNDYSDAVFMDGLIFYNEGNPYIDGEGNAWLVRVGDVTSSDILIAKDAPTICTVDLTQDTLIEIGRVLGTEFKLHDTAVISGGMFTSIENYFQGVQLRGNLPCATYSIAKFGTDDVAMDLSNVLEYKTFNLILTGVPQISTLNVRLIDSNIGVFDYLEYSDIDNISLGTSVLSGNRGPKRVVFSSLSRLIDSGSEVGKGNIVLESIEFPELTVIEEVNSMFSGSELLEISFPKLTRINSGSGLLRDSSVTQYVNLPLLTYARCLNLFDRADNLKSINAPVLKELYSSGNVFNRLGGLVDLSLPSLTTIGAYVDGDSLTLVEGCSDLRSLNIPKLSLLSYASKTPFLSNCGNLESVVLGGDETLEDGVLKYIGVNRTSDDGYSAPLFIGGTGIEKFIMEVDEDFSGTFLGNIGLSNITELSLLLPDGVVAPSIDSENPNLPAAQTYGNYIYRIGETLPVLTHNNVVLRDGQGFADTMMYDVQHDTRIYPVTSGYDVASGMFGTGVYVADEFPSVKQGPFSRVDYNSIKPTLIVTTTGFVDSTTVVPFTPSYSQELGSTNFNLMFLIDGVDVTEYVVISDYSTDDDVDSVGVKTFNVEYRLTTINHDGDYTSDLMVGSVEFEVVEPPTPPVEPPVDPPVPPVVPPVEPPVTGGGGGSTTTDEVLKALSELQFTLPTGVLDMSKLKGLESKYLSGDTIVIEHGVQLVEFTYKGKSYSINIEGVSPYSEPIDFQDVPDHHWAKDSIDTATSKGLLYGVSSTEYNPKGVLTSEESMVAINRVLMLTDNLGMTQRRSSVEKVLGSKRKTDWSYYAVASIMSKLRDEHFSTISKDSIDVKADMTREELARLLYVLTDDMGLEKSGTSASYSDMEYITESIQYCHETGLMVGLADGSFSPKSTLTRAELACVIDRVENVLSK